MDLDLKIYPYDMIAQNQSRLYEGPMKTLKFIILNGSYCIHQLKPGTVLPKSLFNSIFYSVSQTEDELSVVAPVMVKLEAEKTEPGWSVLKIAGPLEFSETGILAGIASTLAEAGISIFAISTFDTDYILVKDAQLKAAKDALSAAGHKFARITRAIVEERTSPTINAYAALLEKQIPLIQSLLNEKVGPAVMATLRSPAAWAAVISRLYEFLPAPIRLVVNRDIFVAYCLRNLNKIMPDASAQLKTKNKKTK
jgi:hypothetical protein